MFKLQDLHTLLMRAAYPATKAELLDFIRKEGYPEAAAERLHALPDGDYRYGSVDSVLDALRGLD